MKTLCVALLLTACAMPCPTERAGDLIEQSGDRLQIRWWETDDGQRFVHAIVDTELGADCHFEAALDGSWACVPEGTPNVVFADPHCGTPRALRQSQFAAMRDYGYCDGSFVTRAFEVGERVAASQYYVLGEQGCRGPFATTELFAAHEVPLRRLARGFERHLPSGGVLDKLVIESDDGLVVPHGIYDRGEQGACSRAGGVCLPSRFAIVKEYASDSCVTRAAQIYNERCTSRVAVDCRTLDAYRVGAPLSSVYALTNGTCAPASPTSDVRWVAVGEAIALPPLRTERGTDPDHRLQQVYDVDDAGFVQHTGRMFDRQLGVECWMQWLGSRERCVPDEFAGNPSVLATATLVFD